MARIKKSILMLVLAALPVSVMASATDDEAHFGVRVQFDMNTSTKETQMVHWGPGVSVGAVYYAPFGKMTYFNAGVLFSYDTYRYEGDTDNRYNLRHYDGHLKNIGLRMPLDFGLKVLESGNTRLSVYTGPHLYFNFSLKADYTSSTSVSSEHINKELTNSGMEIGWGLGVAVDFMRHWHAHVEGTYGLTKFGMTDDIRLGVESHFNRAELSVGVGYNF